MRPFLELLRIHLTPTAVADSLAGFFIARAIVPSASAEVDLLLPLALLCPISVLLYWSGMVTNDLCDLARDRERHPQRPLARGAVSIPQALVLALLLLLAAATLAHSLGVLGVSLALVVAILAYNGGGKRIPVLGSLLMGSCRSLNFLLGAAAAPGVSWAAILDVPSLLVAAATLGLYVTGVTAISLLEDRPYRRLSLAALIGVLLLFPLGLLLQGRLYPGAWVNALLFAGLLVREFRLPDDASRPAGGPHPAEGVVRAGLRGIYFVDAGLLWCQGLWGAALVVYALFLLGWFCLRAWLKSQESHSPESRGES